MGFRLHAPLNWQWGSVPSLISRNWWRWVTISWFWAVIRRGHPAENLDASTGV